MTELTAIKEGHNMNTHKRTYNRTVDFDPANPQLAQRNTCQWRAKRNVLENVAAFVG